MDNTLLEKVSETHPSILEAGSLERIGQGGVNTAYANTRYVLVVGQTDVGMDPYHNTTGLEDSLAEFAALKKAYPDLPLSSPIKGQGDEAKFLYTHNNFVYSAGERLHGEPVNPRNLVHLQSMMQSIADIHTATMGDDGNPRIFRAEGTPIPHPFPPQIWSTIARDYAETFKLNPTDNKRIQTLFEVVHEWYESTAQTLPKGLSHDDYKHQNGIVKPQTGRVHIFDYDFSNHQTPVIANAAEIIIRCAVPEHWKPLWGTYLEERAQRQKPVSPQEQEAVIPAMIYNCAMWIAHSMRGAILEKDNLTLVHAKSQNAAKHLHRAYALQEVIQQSR